jgi:DNA-binding NtrC family response regulator
MRSDTVSATESENKMADHREMMGSATGPARAGDALVALVVEPELGSGRLVERILRSEGWSVIHCESLADAARHASRRDISVLFCEYAPEVAFDADAIAHLRELRGSLPMILMSRAQGATAVATRLQIACLPQSFTPSDVDSALQTALIGFQPF